MKAKIFKKPQTLASYQQYKWEGTNYTHLFTPEKTPKYIDPRTLKKMNDPE